MRNPITVSSLLSLLVPITLLALSTACVEVVESTEELSFGVVEQAIPDLCEGFFYQTCSADDECPGGYGCFFPDGCVASSCFCEPDTGAIACTEDCGIGIGVCEPVGAEGDACGVFDLAPCEAGLECLGGAPEVDRPGTCLVPPRCARTRLFARCEGELALVGGRTRRRLAGQLMVLDVNGEEIGVRVRRNGLFFAVGFFGSESVDVSLVGCEEPTAHVECTTIDR